jgi:hypothetical protein
MFNPLYLPNLTPGFSCTVISIVHPFLSAFVILTFGCSIGFGFSCSRTVFQASSITNGAASEMISPSLTSSLTLSSGALPFLNPGN